MYFQPIITALSDSWLQVKAKPMLYLLIWATLVLIPVLFINQIFSQPIEQAITDFMKHIQDFDQENPSEMVLPSLRLIGYYGATGVLRLLCTIYYGAVLSSTITIFRQYQTPLFTKVLSEGISLYRNFFIAVLIAVWKIFWKPAAAILVSCALSIVLSVGFLYTLGSFFGIVLTFSGLYRYGLGPFIHLSTGRDGKHACMVSLAYYNENRKVITILFLMLIFLPFLVISSLLIAIAGLEASSAASNAFLLAAQSILRFTVMMTLINFAMNTFQDSPEISKKPVPETDALQ